MLTLNSKINKKVVNNLALAGMKLTKDQQQKLLDVFNDNKKITNELIREIAYYGKI